MKKYCFLILSLVTLSCLKEVPPLVENSELEKLEAVENWFVFSDTSRKYHSVYWDYYYLTIEFEVTNDYLLESNNPYRIIVTDKSDNAVYECAAYPKNSKQMFSFELKTLLFSEKEHCFELYFKVINGSEKYGKNEFCKVL